MSVMPGAVRWEPHLGLGRHLHPDDGMCLMEHVSMLAGHAFTDAPRCTDPLLAELARMVNDSIGDDARSSLLRLAPGLASLPGDGRSATAPAIVLAVLDAVPRQWSDRGDLLRHRRRALRMAAVPAPRPGSFEHLRATIYRYGPARHALSCAVFVASEHVEPHADRDFVLAGMLRDAMAAVGDPDRVQVPSSGSS